MIGHYLVTLTPEQEGRVLTNKMYPGSVLDDDGNRCLTGVVQDFYRTPEKLAWPRCPTLNIFWGGIEAWRDTSVSMRFDALCERFGVQRVNAAIRNRILSNQARRELAGQRETVSA